ncbi:right-handed parallel beta-helix repeat-containing protein [bacterium]|nr:right-handed parallel beta-helix repeat-containing protein [bacterium]
MTVRSVFLCTLVFLIISIPSDLVGADWYVDASTERSGNGQYAESAFKKLQEGIDAASDGDTVIAARGTYVENVEFNGKNIVLRSTDPLNSVVVESTIIDGNRAGSVVTFAGTEDESCVLSGFTIRNGIADYGGGIFCWYNNPTIINCVIAGNTAAEIGGGLYGCGGTIQNCTITGNSAGFGGGLGCCDGSIRNCIITANTAGQVGGGLYDCGGTVQNNTITGNSARWGGGLACCGGTIRNNAISANVAIDQVGGALCDCDGIIDGNAITANSAQWGGGLAYCDGTVRNNVISANTAVGQVGGGLYDCRGTVQNNTVVGNSAQWGGGLAYCEGAIYNCIIWGNTAGIAGAQLFESGKPSYSCIQDWTAGGEGNTIGNPVFVDTNGSDDNLSTYEDNDYHLLTTSPCIDAGENENWMEGAVDMDGNPRIFHGKLSSRVDMGAYEYGSFLFRVSQLVNTAGSGVELTWKSRPGDTYTVWSCPELAKGEWSEQATIPSAGETATWTDPDATSTCKFYKIELQ